MSKNKRGKALWRIPSVPEEHVRSVAAHVLSCCTSGKAFQVKSLTYVRNVMESKRHESI